MIRPQVILFDRQAIQQFIRGHSVLHDTAPPAEEDMPRPAVSMFIEHLHARRCLFSQSDFVAYCFSCWKMPESPGFRGTVRRVFIGCISSLYLAALLSETKDFHTIAWAAHDDVYHSTDLSVASRWAPSQFVSIGLTIGTDRAKHYAHVKQFYRGKPAPDCAVIIPLERPKVGNMRWPEHQDCAAVYDFLHLEMRARI